MRMAQEWSLWQLWQTQELDGEPCPYVIDVAYASGMHLGQV